MIRYNNQSMLKKEHARVITAELIKLGSKSPNDTDLNKEHCLAIFYLWLLHMEPTIYLLKR